MEKYITDERTGLRYELVGDYYLIAGEDEPEVAPLGIWGQRRRRFLKEHKRCIYDGMLLTGKLYGYLSDVNQQAEEMFSCLVKQLAEQEGVSEQFKAADQMAWVGSMNNIYTRVTEIINKELIFV